jgi:hypothetical protein
MFPRTLRNGLSIPNPRWRFQTGMDNQQGHLPSDLEGEG